MIDVLRRQSLAEEGRQAQRGSGRFDQTVGEGVGEGVRRLIAVEGRSVRRAGAETGVAWLVEGGHVDHAETATHHGLVVDLIGGAETRLPVVELLVISLPIRRADKLEATVQGKAADRSLKWIDAGEAETGIHLIVALGHGCFVIPPNAKVQSEPVL